MPTFEATAVVAAPPSTVWTTLLQTGRWTSWDPQLESITGALEPGGRVEIRVRGTSRPFRLRVTEHRPGSRLVLSGGMPLGLFVGTRTYSLVPSGAGTTVTVRETYTGPLAGLIGRSVPDLQPSFDAFVQGLRRCRVGGSIDIGSRHGGAAMSDHVEGIGTREDPWILTTPVGTSEFDVWRDEAADPPALWVRVGSTTLSYRLRCIEDLHAMLVAYGDWMPLGNADEQKEAKPGTVEAWARAADNPVGGFYGLRKGYRGRFATYVPPVLEHLGLAEVEHNPRNNRMRAL